MAADHTRTGRRWLGLVGVGVAMMVGAATARAEAPSCTGLKSEVGQLKSELAAKDRAIRMLTQRLRAAAQSNIKAVEDAFVGTGIKVDRLIKRGSADGNQGGPFIPADAAAARDIQRWDALNRVIQVLPLAAPLARYETASGFGKRRDPINKRRAIHEGIDLVAPLRTPVAATGPGKVVFAGLRGRYGKLIEIDHGMGVRTRYAHLGAIKVSVGQSVRPGQVIGLVGSTGRSTGPHLHYEILVDGKPNNPARFLRAGARLGK
ncbi:MAG TPA: M23 family metallopeptidase [Candidatus Omnitrophota bacterium]|nr:M23 family metallopeptidase [Candidatus Omnitrophota bacterium]